MVSAAVNPSDAVTVSGAYASRTSFPFVPGFEGVGVIERVGPGVPVEEIGSRVLPIGSAGCWAQRKRTELSWCIPVPDDLPDDVACFGYINPLTAWLMVERFCSAGVRAVAITAATSTIAGHLAELLSERGIAPIGLVRGTPGRFVAEPSLWRDVISTDDATWPVQLRAASGDRLDVVLDCVGGPSGNPLMDQLAPGGVLVHYGLLSGEPCPPSASMGATASEWRCFGCATRSTRVPATSCRRCSGRPSTACDRAGSAPARRAGCRCPLCRTPSATRVTCTGAKCWSNVNGESTLRTAF